MGLPQFVFPQNLMTSVKSEIKNQGTVNDLNK